MKKTYMFNYKIILFFLLGINAVYAQDSTRVDSLNMDAVYNRPFLLKSKYPVALGGYLEANTLYESEEGISEGFSTQARRLTIFISSTISKRIKFLSEVELEEGGKHIGIEFAAMDVNFHPLLNLRSGIIMNPIGGFNQNHDGPKWEFIDRPEMAVNMLPATWSNAGFGLFGKTYLSSNWTIGYEAYVTNGFDGSIIDNEENKTFLPASKENAERFEESSNGAPMYTGKVAIKNRKIGELGLSYMGGVYNSFEIEEIEIDKKRRLDVFAVDFNTNIKATNTTIIGEYAWILVDVPSQYGQQYGSQQQGAFLDIVQPVYKKTILNWEDAVFSAALRGEYVDWNMGTFNETETNIGEDKISITPAISFRPTQQTVFRLNYRFNLNRDILNNPRTRGAAWMFGVSTYF